MFPTISGYIIDKSTSKPLHNVDVSLDKVSIKTKSNSTGFYSLSAPPGSYKVTFFLMGYQIEIANANTKVFGSVGKDQRVDVTLSLVNASTSNEPSQNSLSSVPSLLPSSKNKPSSTPDTSSIRPKVPKGMQPLEQSPTMTPQPRTFMSNEDPQSAGIPRMSPPKNVLSNEFIKEQSIKIQKKPILITRGEVRNLGRDIKLVSYNPLKDLVADAGKPFSPLLINWVEPYDILGENKTLFYTEVNSGLKVGDRVFIIGGNYDSDALIQADKYKKGRDGYKVLFIDNCRVVLDIDYTGVLPFIEEEIDKFIKVYYIRNVQEFLQASRQVTTGTGLFDYKFNYYQNNIVYADNDYLTGKSWGRSLGILALSSPGFFVKNGPTQSWTNITNQLINSGSYSYALSPTYSNNDRIKIMNGDFTHDGKLFKEGYAYKWYVGPTQSEWIVDVKYNKPFLTKTNFRSGNFDGTWNTGLFGSPNKKIDWEGNVSTWKSGSIINTKWIKGAIDSDFTLPESYTAGFDDYGLPFQKLNIPNNNGRGFNFIYDSDIDSTNIENASIYNSVVGPTSSTYSVVENHILGVSTTYPINVKKAYFEDCDFNHSYISNSEIKNVRTYNSKFENVKSVNSHFRDSVFYNSNYSSESVIKILGYDEINASEYPDVTSTFSVGGSVEAINSSGFPKDAYQKVYKFYIDEDGYNRLRTSDEFYIKGIKFNNNSREILNIFDRKLRLSSWTEYIDDINSVSVEFYKRPIDVTAFLSTPLENSYLFESVRSSSNNYYTSVFGGQNPKKGYSIDVWISLQDVYEQNSGFLTTYLPDLREYLNLNNSLESPVKYDYISATGSGPTSSNIVDVSLAYIVDADFDSGIFENSNWNSGYYVNSSNDLNITTNNPEGGYYNLVFTQSNNIIATSKYNAIVGVEKEYNLSVGQVVYLDNVDFSDGTTTVTLPDTYKVTSNNNGIYILEEIVTGNTSQIISLSQSIGTFSTTGTNNRWGYIKSLKINKSKIKSGIFRRPYIKNSLIETEDYDVLDKDYNNILRAKNLVITDLLSRNNNNYLSSATYLYSHFLSGSDNWNKGIIEYSVWNSGTFSAGVIKQSTWFNGLFTGGYFYNSRSFNATPTSDYQTYDTDRIRSFWKNGVLSNSPAISNNRYSWRNGIFSDGEFYKSDWEMGTFSGGLFWSSKWYDGIFDQGVIGSKLLSYKDTSFYNGTINFATVDNAYIIAEDTSWSGLSSSSVNWKDGIFNDGVFSVEVDNNVQNWATWSAGIFNGGEFTNMAKWKNGTFNNGKFTSYYGWTQSDSMTQSDYGWENGIFNGGEFGNSNGLTNSTWFTGEFNAGNFKGRTWNSGIFLFGDFEGSGLRAVSGATCANASDFVDSYTNSFYGEWRSGYFTDTKDKLIKDKKTITTIQSASAPQERRIRPSKIKNALWKSGTFSHPGGTMENSVWLDGAFEQGTFLKSSFNPYVRRNGSTFSRSFNLNDDTCIWQNGRLVDSEFHISIWKQGTFDIGTATGMIWENGVANYMNAYNVFWENGLWRNGNWNGSVWEFKGEVTEDYVKQILFRGMTWSGTSSCHVWNIFRDDIYTPTTLQVNAATPSVSQPSIFDLPAEDSGDDFVEATP